MNIGFMASHNGSAAKAISEACLNGELRASPTMLITNNPDAKVRVWAENIGLTVYCINRQTHGEITAQTEAIIESLRAHKIKLLVLSGYMKLIASDVIAFMEGRVVNIHPALLPAYGGQGMFGRHIHEAVKANNEQQTGITIHQVNAEFDKGKILAQTILPISERDSVDDIEAKARAAEPDFYIQTLRKILDGDITLDPSGAS